MGPGVSGAAGGGNWVCIVIVNGLAGVAVKFIEVKTCVSPQPGLVPAVPGALGNEAPRWDPKAPWVVFASPNNHALAGTDEDRPGQWNQLDLVCMQDDCVHIVNGKVVMALANARYKDGESWVPMTGGKLQIQSEAAEVFYKDIEIRTIPAMPAEYAKYF